MANYCTWGKPANWGGTSAQWQDGLPHGAGGISDPETLSAKAKAATSTPFYFNADEFNIVCASFPSAGGGPDPLISQAAAITALQAQATGLQSQITAIAPWTGASTSEAQQAYFDDVNELWYLFFAAAILIMCAKMVQRFWDRAPHE